MLILKFGEYVNKFGFVFFSKKEVKHQFIMKRYLILLILSFISVFVFSQSNDTINQFDKKGLKQGYWIEYLNKHLKYTNESNHVYYRYQYYIDGHSITHPFFYTAHLLNQHAVVYNVVLPDSVGVPKLLNGNYTAYYPNGKLLYRIHFRSGLPCGIWKIYNKNGILSEYRDYNFTFCNQKFSFLSITGQTERGFFATKSFYRNGKKGWGFYKIKEIKEIYQDTSKIKKVYIYSDLKAKMNKLQKFNSSAGLYYPNVDININDSLFLKHYYNAVESVNLYIGSSIDSVPIVISDKNSCYSTFVDVKQKNEIYVKLSWNSENRNFKVTEIEKETALFEIKKLKLYFSKSNKKR